MFPGKRVLELCSFTPKNTGFSFFDEFNNYVQTINKNLRGLQLQRLLTV